MKETKKGPSLCLAGGEKTVWPPASYEIQGAKHQSEVNTLPLACFINLHGEATQNSKETFIWK